MTKNVLFRQKGITLLETLIALTIMGIVTAVSFVNAQQYANDIVDQQVSTQSKMVTDAAKRWVMDNFSAVQGVATAGTPHILSTATLIAGGYLPSSFSGKNAYGQSYEIKTLQPSANALETLIVTVGGSAIESGRVAQVAAMMGASGGYIPYAGGPGGCNSNGVICGSYGGWYVSDSSDYWSAGSGNPGSGHLASMVAIENGTVRDDFLYRNAVPGQPQLNRMNTAIDMGGNNIDNVNTITGNAGVLNINDTTTNITSNSLNIVGNTVMTGNHDVSGTITLTGAAGQVKMASGGVFDDAGNDLRLMAAAGTGGKLVLQDVGGGKMGAIGNDFELDSADEPGGQNKSLGRAVTFSAIALPGDTVNKPTCVTGLVPRILLAPSQVAYSASGEPLEAVQAWATDNGGSWTVNLEVTSPVGQTPDHVGAGNKVLVIVKCA